MLQALQQAHVAAVRQAERVVDPERHAVSETAIERRLDGVVRLVEHREVEVDRGETTVRPQQVGGERIRAGRGRGRQRQILILREKRHAEIRRVDIHHVLAAHFPQLVEGTLSDVGDVERR